MTTEQKAKAYDEALKKLHEIITMDNHPVLPKEIGEFLFPELTESEDDRIRKFLIEILSHSSWRKEWPFSPNEVITYLERQKEQSGEDEEDNDFTIYYPLKNGKGKYECIPYSFYGSLTSFSEDKDLIDFLRTCFYTEEECNEWIEQQKEQKPERINITDMVAKYSATDEYVEGEYKGKPVNCMIRAYEQGIRDTLLRVKEQKPAEWSEDKIRTVFDDYIEGRDTYTSCINRLKALKNRGNSPKSNTNSHWKPSKEQMDCLVVAASGYRNSEVADVLNSLINDLKKL